MCARKKNPLVRDELQRFVVAGGGAGWMRGAAGTRGGRKWSDGDAVVAGEVRRCGCRGGWKERRKLGLGFWKMKMMTWQDLIG